MFYVILATDKCRKQESELHNDGLSGAFTVKTEKKNQIDPKVVVFQRPQKTARDLEIYNSNRIGHGLKTVRDEPKGN